MLFLSLNLGVILIDFKKQAESIAKNNEFPNPLGFINIPWATKSSPWGSRLIAQGEFMGDKGPLVGYYATKGGLLLVAYLGQSASQPRWANNSSPW